MTFSAHKFPLFFFLSFFFALDHINLFFLLFFLFLTHTVYRFLICLLTVNTYSLCLLTGFFLGNDAFFFPLPFSHRTSPSNFTPTNVHWQPPAKIEKENKKAKLSKHTYILNLFHRLSIFSCPFFLPQAPEKHPR